MKPQPFEEQRFIDSDGKPMVKREAPNRVMTKAVLTGGTLGVPEMPEIPAWQEWENDCYHGSFRRYASGFPIGGGPYVILGITAKSEKAEHDWRDFQTIKNDLVGEEWEAVELYPAESRLVDPSNRFYLWCVPKGVFTFGFQERSVEGMRQNGPPQRPFGRKP